VTTISKKLVLTFLVYLHTDKRFNPKTILVARNALHLPLSYGFRISTHDKEFGLLARAQFIQNPPTQKLVPQWNLEAVLSLLSTPRFRNSSASIADLFLKTLFLTALASGKRVSELAALQRSPLSLAPRDSAITLSVRKGFLHKNQTADRTPAALTIPALLVLDAHHKLCPVRTIKVYVRRSRVSPRSQALFADPRTLKPLKAHC